MTQILIFFVGLGIGYVIARSQSEAHDPNWLDESILDEHTPPSQNASRKAAPSHLHHEEKRKIMSYLCGRGEITIEQAEHVLENTDKAHHLIQELEAEGIIRKQQKEGEALCYVCR